MEVIDYPCRVASFRGGGVSALANQEKGNWESELQGHKKVHARAALCRRVVCLIGRPLFYLRSEGWWGRRRRWQWKWPRLDRSEGAKAGFATTSREEEFQENKECKHHAHISHECTWNSSLTLTFIHAYIHASLPSFLCSFIIMPYTICTWYGRFWILCWWLRHTNFTVWHVNNKTTYRMSKSDINVNHVSWRNSVS